MYFQNGALPRELNSQVVESTTKIENSQQVFESDVHMYLIFEIKCKGEKFIHQSTSVVVLKRFQEIYLFFY